MSSCKKQSSVKMRALLLPLVLFFITAHLLPAQASSVDRSPRSLHRALNECAEYFAARLEQGSKVVILNIESGYPRLSAYIIEELTAIIVNGGVLKPVERQNLDQLQREMQYQLSGAVSDGTAKRIGQHIGADVVLTGSISPEGSGLRLQIRAINVETAEIPAMAVKNVRRDSAVNAMLREQQDGAVSRDDAWKYKRLYLGLRGGASPRLHTLNTNDDLQVFSVSAEGAVPLRIQISGLFSLGAEAVVSIDKTDVTEPGIVTTALMLEIPVLARLSFYHGKFCFGLFAGPRISIPLGSMDVTYGGETASYEYTAPLGFLAGASVGVKLGPGALFLDLRGGADLGAVRTDSADQYRRILFAVSAGYEFGLFDR